MSSQLDAIKARAEAATEGPWETVRVYDNVYEVQLPDAPKPTESHFATSDLQNRFLHNDAEFVAHARTDVPVLVAAVEAVLELHKEVGSWRSGVYQCGQCAELCHSTSGLGCEDPIDAVWPCPTVVAIQAALGEGEK